MVVGLGQSGGAFASVKFSLNGKKHLFLIHQITASCTYWNAKKLTLILLLWFRLWSSRKMDEFIELISWLTGLERGVETLIPGWKYMPDNLNTTDPKDLSLNPCLVVSSNYSGTIILMSLVWPLTIRCSSQKAVGLGHSQEWCIASGWFTTPNSANDAIQQKPSHPSGELMVKIITLIGSMALLAISGLPDGLRHRAGPRCLLTDHSAKWVWTLLFITWLWS